jgi:uncharacterized protein YhfF
MPQNEDLPRFSFGDTPELASQLGELAVKGIKTATCDRFTSNTVLPRAGRRWIVEDHQGRRLCVIETIEVRVTRFDDVDATFAYDEGEGDRSLGAWRTAHQRYFTRTGGFSHDMLIICERFRLVASGPFCCRDTSVNR